MFNNKLIGFSLESVDKTLSIIYELTLIPGIVLRDIPIVDTTTNNIEI